MKLQIDITWPNQVILEVTYEKGVSFPIRRHELVGGDEHRFKSFNDVYECLAGNTEKVKSLFYTKRNEFLERLDSLGNNQETERLYTRAREI
jgi:predicted DNA-binding antitoxin AbrB/MazE fold protein